MGDRRYALLKHGHTASDIDAEASTDGYVLTSDGAGNAAWEDAAASPAGSDNEIQFNNAGVFGASSNLTWDDTTLLVSGAVVDAQVLEVQNNTNAGGDKINIRTSNSVSTNYTPLHMEIGNSHFYLTVSGGGFSYTSGYYAGPNAGSGVDSAVWAATKSGGNGDEISFMFGDKLETGCFMNSTLVENYGKYRQFVIGPTTVLTLRNRDHAFPENLPQMNDRGQIWTDSDFTPCQLVFTDDGGTDHYIQNEAAPSYDVTEYGNDQVLTTSNNIVLMNGTWTATLPTAVGNDEKVFTIKNIGTGTVTVDGDGSETIDSETTVTLAPLEAVKIVSDGTEWWII